MDKKAKENIVVAKIQKIESMIYENELDIKIMEGTKEDRRVIQNKQQIVERQKEAIKILNTELEEVKNG